MHRERGVGGGGGSRSEKGQVDRKRINDALDKQLERSSPSTSSRALNNNAKDKDRLLAQSMLAAAKPPPDRRDPRPAPLKPENKRSDGHSSLSLSLYTHIYTHEFICMNICMWVYLF